jgi:DNA-binding MarR family transcriptional regulator/GNAT superfamily N-acetyltransferase
MDPTLAHIEPIRAASRRLVRELGFLRGTLAGTALPPSAVHTLVEIGAAGTLRATELASRLSLEKSSVSRLLRKLIGDGLLRETPGDTDARSKILSLTARGKKLLAGIDTFARAQVFDALKQLSPAQYAVVAQGLGLYAQALAGETREPPVIIDHGYTVNVFARCVEMHATFYAKAHGFGAAFEAVVAGGLAGFGPRMDKPRNRLWRATQAGRIVGTIAIDGEDLGANHAHLRWFIVDDGVRGGGVGHKLLAAALAFCDKRKFAETHLWTFRGLDIARRLYEANGFVLSEERPGGQWGKKVLEQRFVRLSLDTQNGMRGAAIQ